MCRRLLFSANERPYSHYMRKKAIPQSRPEEYVGGGGGGGKAEEEGKGVVMGFVPVPFPSWSGDSMCSRPLSAGD